MVLNKTNAFIIITVVTVMLLSVILRKPTEIIRETKVVDEKTSKVLEEISADVSRYKVKISELNVKSKIEKDSIIKYYEMKIYQKNVEISNIKKEKEKISNTFISFDYAEEFYGLGKKIKNLKLSKSEFESIKQEQFTKAEFEKEISNIKRDVDVKVMIIDSLNNNNDLLEKDKALLMSKLDEYKTETHTLDEKEIKRYSKSYSISLSVNEVYDSTFSNNLNVQVKKYVIPFSQDGVFISGGYINKDIIDFKSNHSGYVGVGIEF